MPTDLQSASAVGATPTWLEGVRVSWTEWLHWRMDWKWQTKFWARETARIYCALESQCGPHWQFCLKWRSYHNDLVPANTSWNHQQREPSSHKMNRKERGQILRGGGTASTITNPTKTCQGVASSGAKQHAGQCACPRPTLRCNTSTRASNNDRTTRMYSLWTGTVMQHPNKPGDAESQMQIHTL